MRENLGVLSFWDGLSSLSKRFSGWTPFLKMTRLGFLSSWLKRVPTVHAHQIFIGRFLSFLHVCAVWWASSVFSSFPFLPLSVSPLPPATASAYFHFQVIYMCTQTCKILCISIKFKTSNWGSAWDICLPETDLTESMCTFLMTFIRLQKTRLYPPFWLKTFYYADKPRFLIHPHLSGQQAGPITQLFCRLCVSISVLCRLGVLWGKDAGAGSWVMRETYCCFSLGKLHIDFHRGCPTLHSWYTTLRSLN